MLLSIYYSFTEYFELLHRFVYQQDRTSRFCFFYDNDFDAVGIVLTPLLVTALIFFLVLLGFEHLLRSIDVLNYRHAVMMVLMKI